MSRRLVVQVEQLLDDGSHPVIAGRLFGDEYGAGRPVPAVEVVALCPGQRDIFEELSVPAGSVSVQDVES